MTEQWSTGPTTGPASGSGGVKDVAGEAMTQAAHVVDEAKTQVRDLVGQAGDELRTQGDTQTERLAEGLRTVAGQLQALLDGRPAEAGRLPDLARQASDRLQAMASHLADGGVQGLSTDAQGFARRRPGAFLAGAAAIGFAAGRMLRGAQAAGGASTGSSTPSYQPPVAPPAEPFLGEAPEVLVLEQQQPQQPAAPSVPGPVR